MKKLLSAFLIALVLGGGALFAQAKPAAAAAPAAKKPQATLVYFEDPAEIVVLDAEKNEVEAVVGMALLPGFTIQTKKTAAEIKLEPNGTIIKMTPMTNFKIEGLQGLDGAVSNDFQLVTGKIRAVAAKLAGAPTAYSIKTPTAVCGVRGTDFALKSELDENCVPTKDWVCVQEGKVDYTNAVTGESVPVGAGQFADTFAAVFSAAPASAEQLQEIFSDLGFTALSVTDVPSQDTSVVADKAEETKEEKKEEGKASAPSKDALLDALKKILGFEIGSVTIDGATYSKAVIQPNINLDSFKIGLYLPIIYTKDIFDPSTWYHPAGNDEWSFGTDVSFGDNWYNRGMDFLSDLALKIKYIEIGRQSFDPFYLKVGSLKTMTIGHGSLMLNFANDADFPAIRKIGLNTGVTLGPIGLEAIVDDLSDPGVVGGRLSVGIVPQFTEIGVSSIVDLEPAEGLSGSPAAGKPMLITAGADLQLAKLDLGLMKAILFADVGTFLPYYRDQFGAYKGLVMDTVLKDGKPRNFGVTAGAYGSLLVIDYRFEFRFAQGIYKNTIFQANYDRTKGAYIGDIGTYLTGGYPNADTTTTVGVYGTGSFKLLEMAAFDLGYLWPLALSAGGLDTSSDDYLKVKVEVYKDKIPFIPLSGSFSYERTKLAKTIMDLIKGGSTGLYLFDANTVLKGEMVYGLGTGLDLVIGLSTNIIRDAGGNIQYQSDNVTPKMAPAINIETRVSFN